jgi:predicted nucleic acid-binding protein
MSELPASEQLTLAPVVVDTDVVSYLFKEDSRAVRYETHLVGRAPVVSFMTLAELDAWADQRNWGERRRERLERFLAKFAPHFPDRRLCRIWGAVTTTCRLTGRPIGPADAWIAATALFLSAPLVTHNPFDYASVPGLTVLSEVTP